MEENTQSEHAHDHTHGHDHSHPSAEGQDNRAQAYLELQMLQQQLDETQKILESIDLQLTELSEMTAALDDIEKTPTDADILVPVVRGMFASATLKDVKTLKVNIGTNTLVDKTLSEAREMLGQQLMELAQYKDQVSHQQDALIRHAKDLGANVTMESHAH